MMRLLRPRLFAFAVSAGCLLVLLSPTALAHDGCVAAPNLTATAEEYSSSGILYKRLLFKDERRRGEMELPNGWTHRNVAPTQLHLIPAGARFAEVVITTLPLPKAAPTDKSPTNRLEQQALASVPPTSLDVSIIRAGQGSDVPAGDSSEVVVSYKALGYRFHRSIAVVNAPDHQMVIQLTATEADFDALTAKLRRALQSWHWEPLEAPVATQPESAPSTEQPVS